MQSTATQTETPIFDSLESICSNERHYYFNEQLVSILGESVAAEVKAERIVQLFSTLPSPQFFLQDFAFDSDPNFSGVAGLFAQDARIHEGQTIREHTIRVVGQYLKYFSELRLPTPLTLEAMVTMLCLHDIGKSLPSNKNEQHEWTLKVFEYLMERNYLPLTNEQYHITKEIVSGDPIGALIKSSLINGPKFATKLALYETTLDGTLSWNAIQEKLIDASEYGILGKDSNSFQKAVECLQNKAKFCGLTPGDFLRLQLLFFQVDTSAYTVDSRNQNGRSGIPSLEGLYNIQNGAANHNQGNSLLHLTRERHRLEFQSGIEATIRNLEKSFSPEGL